MVWTTRNSLNRWCLRSLLDNATSPLHELLHEATGVRTQVLKQCKGRPPLMNSCIAPHCDAWSPLDEERGVCVFRKRLKEVFAEPRP